MEALPQTNLSSSSPSSSSSSDASSEKLETVVSLSHRRDEAGGREGDDSSKVTMAEERQPEITAKSSSSDDPMLGFLGLLGQPSKPSCANCENKEQSPMFFCNTCCQAICASCKQNTHSAKMFSLHDVTSVSPYTREPQRKCPVHDENAVLFSPANESLLCITCFRYLPPDIRAQCLDLDTAYQQKIERLHRGLKAVSELEVTIKDEATVYRGLLKELHMNAMREESTVHVFSKILQGVVTQTEEHLIDAIKSEIQTKEIVFEEKLKTLESLQANVQAYLTLSTAFIGSASKFELLKLANGLVERLSDIGTVVHPTKISPENSTISSNFKAEFSRNLKELFHHDLWMHEHFVASTINNTSLKTATAEGDHHQNNKQMTDTKVSAVPEKCLPPLPFLGRSQSLLNIPLSLDIANTTNKKMTSLVDSSLPPQVVAVNQSSGVKQQQQNTPRRPLLSNNSSKRNIPNHYHHQPDIIKYQSLPHKESQSKKSSQHQQCRNKGYSTVPHRSKSVDTKSAQQQMHNYNYNVSQVELFATIQRHSRGQVANSKNMTVTSSATMVGVANNSNNNNHIKPSEIIVQAMVHQDAEMVGGRNPSSSTAQRPKSFDPIYEPLVDPCYRRTNDVMSSSSTAEAASIELTADQVRQLIRAISAAQVVHHQSNNGPPGWPMTGHQPHQPPSQQLPERDMNVASSNNPTRLSSSGGRGLERSDSFEGHEEAVSLLVDAVREIQSICNAKKGCEHL